MNRRNLLKTAVGVGIGVISSAPDTYFANWERERLGYGTHYWKQDGDACLEYKEYESEQIVIVYTLDDGDVEQLVKTEARGREDAKRILSDIRATLSI